MNDTENRKAVIYVRTALQHVGTDLVLKEQEMKCRSHAETSHYVVTNVFRDVASGNGARRPEFDAMLKFISENRQDKYRVLIADPKRLSRNVTMHLNLRQRIIEAGGSIEFVERLLPHIENRLRLADKERER
jgi:DNA invertase Pin-like site-specific DNA recombinase